MWRGAAGRLEVLTRPHGPGLSDAGRLVAAATAIFSVAAGVIHVSAAADHENLPVMLVGFLVVATLQVALGGLLLWRRPSGLLLVGALGLMLGSVGVWLVSRTLGLPFLPGGHMEPIGFKDGVTVVFELASVPGLLLLMSRELGGVRLPSPRLGSQALGFLGAGAFMLMVPAMVLGGGEHHSHEQAVAMGIHSDDGHHHGEEAAAGGGSGGMGHSHGGSDQGSGGGHDHGGGAGGADSAGAELSQSGGHDHGGGEELASVLPGDPGGGHAHPGGEMRSRGGNGGHEHGGDRRRHTGGGHKHGGGGGQAEGEHQHGGGGQGHGGDGGHGEGGGSGEPENPGFTWGAHRFEYQAAREGKDGEVGSGNAFVYKGPPDKSSGTIGHNDHGNCQPTTEQQAAADRVYRATAAALKKYDNNFGRALADGFTYTFPLTDRIIHMVNPDEVDDPTILDSAKLESFLYAMTDRGLVAIAGMYIMPRAGMRGPEFGGCLTKWHQHAGVVGLAVSAGTMRETPEMLHVWTYPGLKPWAHYDSRQLSQLWGPGSVIPSFCRESGDSSDACIP